MWIATDYGLNRYDGYSFQTFLHDENDSLSLSCNTVVSLFCDRDGQLWVGTNTGLDRFEPDIEAFTHYPTSDGYEPRVSNIIQLEDGRLLVGTAGYGIYVLDKTTGQRDTKKARQQGDKSDRILHPYPLGEEYSFSSRLCQDNEGRIWRTGFSDAVTLIKDTVLCTYHSEVGTPIRISKYGDEIMVTCQHGIMTYHNGRFERSSIDLSAISANDANISSVTTSSDGTIYLGTRGYGIFRVLPSTGRAERIEMGALGVDPSTAKVSTLYIDRRGNVWAGLERKGLLVLQQNPKPFANWSFEAQGLRLGSTISSVCEGDNGIMWCTVQGVGVYGFNRQGRVVAHPQAPLAAEFIFRDNENRYWLGTDDGLYNYDPLTGRYKLRVTFDCDMYNDMTNGIDGKIYISTFSRGFCSFNPTTGELRNFNMNDANDARRGRLCNNWIMAMMPDDEGRLWLATSSGVSCYDPSTDSFRPYGWDVLLPNTMCLSLCQSSKGHILIGTDKGLYVYKPGETKAERFRHDNGLKDKVVTYITESNNGDLWCSTSAGIWQFESSSNHFIGHLAGNGLTKKEYVFNVGLHTDSDLVCFGHNDGLTVFSPTDIIEAPVTLDTLQLTSFRVGDQYVSARTVINGVQVTDKAVSTSTHFTLSHLDHTITMAFSPFNFEPPMNLNYEYRVNGGSWVRNVEGKNYITLGHLQPGTYNIEVRAQQGAVYTPVKSLTITIRAPWYLSTLAKLLYALLGAALLVYIFYAYRRRANQQLNEEKMKFLINATHDIRSPLTLILAALKKLKAEAGDATSSALGTIDHNSQRILALVNQILDVRKIDKQQMQLHCQQTDMVGFVSSIVKMFEYNAQERGITFTFRHEGIEHLDAWIDRTQFDKVVTNLLSNAFKYSNDGGEVTIELLTNDNGKHGSLTLKVYDNGIGMDNDSLKHAFERFYQGQNSRRIHIDGTGIGLNLCKMIVDMHHGTIDAANRTDTRGSVFTVTLPLGKDHLQPAEIDTTPPPAKLPAESARQSSSSAKHRVLIVDDDEEIGRYIEAELGRHYKFTLCHNGKDGLKELLTGGDYDLVISDVMMPEMDGFTMLRMIKTNLNLNHLPVVMLTSKADVGNRLEGLERGADAFLAKPFDMDLLHATIENLIQGRKRLKGRFSGAQQPTMVEQIEVKGNDEQLMERIMKAINKNLSDSDFNVEMLTQEVGISRAQLHRKMKELTGISTSEFVRNIRLEQAARLLKEQKLNITQVAYAVGFSNLAHFSTIFRRHFGVSPSEYAES
jgi:signal transduction histidine kinase/ligand-binding sensor domain-containing protein/DNA-binding response OmpR family regulator